MHQETVHRLSLLVTQQAAGFGGDFDSGIPPITWFRNVDDVERIANDLELAAGTGLMPPVRKWRGSFTNWL